MLGWGWAGGAMLLIAAVLWLTLIAPVLRNWVTPTVGLSLMLTVSTESLAVLSSALAVRMRADWLLYTALLPFVLGLALYACVIARFDVLQLVVGNGDHWITGGALAIAALAATELSLAAKSLHQPVAVADVFPVAMYAACSFAVGATAHAAVIVDFARIWVWAGLALWSVVSAAMAVRGASLARRGSGSRLE
jgi:hypothetical protein